MNVRGVNIHGPSVGIGSVLGLAAGVAGSYGLYRLVLLPKHQREIGEKVDERVNAEASIIRSQYNDRLKESLASVVSGAAGADDSTDKKQAPVGRKRERPPAVNYAAIRPATGPPSPDDPRLEGLEEPDDEQPADADGPEGGSQEEYHNVFEDHPAGDGPKIRRATREEFGEVPPGFTTEVLTWYAGDGILCDEAGDPIRNALPVIGTERPEFGYLKEDPYVYLVINEELDLCIEVIYKEMSWAEAIGYGDPAKIREANQEG